MSTTVRSREVPPRFRARAGFWLKFAAFTGVILVALGTSVGVGQSPAPKPSDDVLQLRVQSALDNDAVLKPHKLIVLVNVVDRVAVIGGPVPDSSVAARLETVAKSVPGIAGVKASVWVPSSLVPDDPLSKKVAELMKTEPAKPVSVPTPMAPVLSLPPRPEPAATVVTAVPPQPVPVPQPVADPRPRGTVTSNKGPDGLLLDPVAPTGTGFRPSPLAPGAEPLPYTTIPPPNVPVVPPQPEPEAKPRPPEYSPVTAPAEPPAKGPVGLDDLRKDARFAGLKVELADGVAVVSGRATGGSERRWELAQAVRKLPGVERVVVRQP